MKESLPCARFDGKPSRKAQNLLSGSPGSPIQSSTIRSPGSRAARARGKTSSGLAKSKLMRMVLGATSCFGPTGRTVSTHLLVAKRSLD